MKTVKIKLNAEVNWDSSLVQQKDLIRQMTEILPGTLLELPLTVNKQHVNVTLSLSFSSDPVNFRAGLGEAKISTIANEKFFYIHEPNTGRILACLAYRFTEDNGHIGAEYGYSVANPLDFKKINSLPAKKLAKKIASGRLAVRALKVPELDLTRKRVFIYMLDHFLKQLPTEAAARLQSALNANAVNKEQNNER